jgi:hypothetical protein
MAAFASAATVIDALQASGGTGSRYGRIMITLTGVSALVASLITVV